MFRKIRRKNKEISTESTKLLLTNERRGVLAVNGDDGYPYAVPINFLYCEKENKIYFHSACCGHKADSLKKSDKICFTVYGNERVKEEAWAPFLQSAVVFGRCKPISDKTNKTEILRKFALKYYPDLKTVDEEIAKSGNAAQIYEIEIETFSGKEIQEK